MVNKFDPNALGHMDSIMGALQRAGFKFDRLGGRRLKMVSTGNMNALQKLGKLVELPSSFDREHERHISMLIAPHTPEGFDTEVKARMKRGKSPEMHIDIIQR